MENYKFRPIKLRMQEGLSEKPDQNVQQRTKSLQAEQKRKVYLATRKARQ